jgi:hypothetical protein
MHAVQPVQTVYLLHLAAQLPGVHQPALVLLNLCCQLPPQGCIRPQSSQRRQGCCLRLLQWRRYLLLSLSDAGDRLAHPHNP